MHSIRNGDLAYNYINSGMRKHRPLWTDMYSCEEFLVDGLKLDGDASAFVDVGGSMGNILQGIIFV